MPVDITRADLLTEQLAHFKDGISARLDSVNESLRHHKELDAENHKAILDTLAELRCQAADFESRIRELTATATQFRLLASLATGGGLLSLIALIRELTR